MAQFYITLYDVVPPSPSSRDSASVGIMHCPIWPRLSPKSKGHQLCYYVVESGRVDGKPPTIDQVYLGTAEKLAASVRHKAAPVPLSATRWQFGLPGALWLAALESGVFDTLHELWSQPRSGPSTAHYLLLAGLQRICAPAPKTEAADWYRQTVLHPLWRFPPERSTSRAFGTVSGRFARARSGWMRANRMIRIGSRCACSGCGSDRT